MGFPPPICLCVCMYTYVYTHIQAYMKKQFLLDFFLMFLSCISKKNDLLPKWAFPLRYGYVCVCIDVCIHTYKLA